MAEQKLFFDDIKEGDTGPEFSHELGRTDLVMYAGASGDFNPMHTDEVAAQALVVAADILASADWGSAGAAGCGPSTPPAPAT